MKFGHTEYAYFFFYSWVRGWYIRRKTSLLAAGSKAPSLSTAAELALGAIAGGLAQIFTIPVAVIATRQQVSTSKPLTAEEKAAGVQRKGDSFLEVARDIIREDGVQGLWLGIKPGLILTVNPSITYGLFERVKTFALLNEPENTKLTPGKSFLVGALSKSLATVVRFRECLHIFMCPDCFGVFVGNIPLHHGKGSRPGAFHRCAGIPRQGCRRGSSAFIQ